MSDLLIKDIDEEVVKELSENALKFGKSIEDYAKALLVEKVTPSKKMSKEELFKFAEEFRKKVGPQKTDSTLLIREDRDNR
jgi:plasmid stability protein